LVGLASSFPWMARHSVSCAGAAATWCQGNVDGSPVATFESENSGGQATLRALYTGQSVERTKASMYPRQNPVHESGNMFEDRLLRWFLRPCLDSATCVASPMPVALATDIGRTRKENQDRVAVMRVSPGKSGRPYLVAALVDGMGGMRDGQQCAALAISRFLFGSIKFRAEPLIERLEQATSLANEEVFRYVRGKGGATLSAVIVDASGQAAQINVGDSRIYATKADRRERSLTRLTKDDSLAEAIGGESRELLRFVGMGPSLMPTARLVPNGFDRLLLTSDGVHYLNSDTLDRLVLGASDIEEAADRLMRTAAWCGGPDNASIVALALPEISGSLRQRDAESGIDVWDPFSAIQVIWVSDPLIGAAVDQSDQGKQWQSPKINTERRVKQPLTRNRSKKKQPRSKKSKQNADTQLKIEIED
jgi:PPM family protein phosphatase